MGHEKNESRKEVSKDLQKLFKRESRQRQRSKIKNILSEFKGLKQIGKIRSNGRRAHVCSMYNGSGEL
eukprot:9028089-Karenia_brevis.AAC.1